LRNDYGIEPRKKINFAIKPNDDAAFLESELPALKMFLNAEEIAIDPRYQATGLTPGLVTKTATIFMVGAVDPEAERQRLKKQLADIEKQLAATESKLANENFVAKAAPIAVQREREKLQQLREQREKVQALLKQLGN
jgi:valyl-tRNA synthetase